MQTFLASYNLKENAAFLDNKRLFCQLKEGYQILSSLTGGKDWINHPAVKQWKGSEGALFLYIYSIYQECQNRGIAKNTDLLNKAKNLVDTQQAAHKPSWWFREDIAASHRSRLLCKGEIDSYCFALKKHLKIKKIDTWLKSKLNKTKNQLKFSDIESLHNLLPKDIKVDRPPNHYANFGWTEPMNLDYVWPANL